MNSVEQSEKPLVSVIMALYNAEKYVEDAINSVLAQTYSNFELIVVDDGSTDNSTDKVIKLAEKDNRIYLYHQSNKGQCVASNYGFKQSKGKYIKFFDSDDILSSNTILSQVNALQGKTELDGSYIDYIRFYNDDLGTANSNGRPALINHDCTPIEYITFHGSPQMYNNALWLFHRKLFEIGGIWDERLSVNNDGEFLPRLLQYVNRLYYAPANKLYYRTNFKSGSLSQGVSKKGVESALMSVDMMAKYVRSMENSKIIEQIIAQSYVQVLGMSFPAYPKITREIETRLKQFDRSAYTFSETGKLYNVFQKLLGWKIAKRLQIVYYRYKYS